MFREDQAQSLTLRLDETTHYEKKSPKIGQKSQRCPLVPLLGVPQEYQPSQPLQMCRGSRLDPFRLLSCRFSLCELLGGLYLILCLLLVALTLLASTILLPPVPHDHCLPPPPPRRQSMPNVQLQSLNMLLSIAG